MPGVESIDISDEPDAVPGARRRAAAALTRLGCDAVADAAQLVVSELVTNAILHAGFPVRLELSRSGNVTHVAVHDRSRQIPVRLVRRSEGMTGRGLALVDAMATAWGASPTTEGKVVWADITADSAAAEEPAEVDLHNILDTFEDWSDDLGKQTFTVTLGDVPTNLLLEAKAHVDSVIRELTLSAAGAASGMSAALPPHLAELVHNVATEFSAARQAIKRQAVEAAESDERRTALTLSLPASAAEAGERYLEALESADAFARASRLLTLAAPPQHRAFRRWYVTALVEALRQEASGHAPAPAETFEAYLLRQVDDLAALQEVSARAARLQRVTAAMAAELTAERAAEVALDDAIAEIGASRGCALLTGSQEAPGTLRSAGTMGYHPEMYERMLTAWQSSADLPVNRAIANGEPVWLEARDEFMPQFPTLDELEPDVGALCVIPMTVADHVVGVLRLSFAHSRLFTYDERAFLVALGAVTAQALERANLYQLQATVADQLRRLQRVTAALSQVSSLDDVVDVTITHAIGLVGARVASVNLVEPDGITVRLVRIEPRIPGENKWVTHELAADLPATEVIRSGRQLHVATVAEIRHRWPVFAALDWEFEHALLVLPLTADNVTIGAISLQFSTESGDGEPAHEFLMAFADACAQAIGRAQAAERADDAHRKLALLVDSNQDHHDELTRLIETMPDAFYRLDREWRFTYVNAQAERVFLRPRSELLGRIVWECYPDVVGTVVETEFRRAVQTGGQTSFEIYYAPLLSWFDVRATPDSEGLLAFFHDITARKEAEDARTAAHGRLALLAEAARGLVGTLDVQTVMHQAASVVVPRLADWAVVALVDHGTQPREHHGLHYDAVVAAEAERAAELIAERLPASKHLASVMVTGDPLLLRTVDIKAIAATIDGSELPNLLETLGFASLLVVPLQSGAATVGLLGLVNGPARTPFGDDDVATAVDIGRRAGLALDNAQLYARQRTASELLQRSLLTPLPEPDLLQVVARYRPAGQEAQIGGDWYDAFLQPDGTTVVAIGDVVGHDMNAAAAMGQLRNLLRGVAFDRQEAPAAVLRRVDAAIRGLRVDTLATAVVGRLEQSAEQRARLETTFRWSNAGHPPPLLLRDDGAVLVLEGEADLLLGLDVETERQDQVVTMGAGDTLLMYTDGMVERRDSPIQEGLARLQKTFGDLAGLELDALCDALMRALLPDDADDDVALVAVRALREVRVQAPR